MRRDVPAGVAAAVGVALGRADRQARRGRDLREAEVEGVLQRDHGRLCRRQLGEAAPSSRRVSAAAAAMTGSPSRAARSSSWSGSVRRACFACASPCRCSRRAGAARSRTTTRRGTGARGRRASRANPGPRRARPRGRAAGDAPIAPHFGACRSQSAASARASPSFARFTKIGSLSLSWTSGGSGRRSCPIGRERKRGGCTRRV